MGELPVVRPRWWTAAVTAAVVVTVAHLVWMILRPGGEYLAAAVSDVTATLGAIAAGVACLQVALRGVRAQRTSWLLFAGGLFAWAAGEVVWSWYELVLRAEVPFPSLADVGFLLFVPLSVAAMAMQVRLGRDGLRTLLDGLIISGSLLALSWATVLAETIEAAGEDVLTGAVSLAYPVGDVVVASMAFLLLSHAGRHRRVALSLIGAGALLMSVADSGFVYLGLNELYSSGLPIDTAWFGAFLLMGLGALRVDTGTYRSAASAPLWIGLPYVPFGIAATASIGMHADRGSLDTPLYLLMMVIVGLVVVRQVLTMRENQLLNRQLTLTVAELSGRERQLHHLAFHDPLTGLANRALFVTRLEQALATSPPGTVGVVFVDLDGFKKVNDELGHGIGDQLLILVANRLATCVRTGDTLARLGGDEFAVILRHPTGQEEAEAVAQRIVSLAAQSFLIDGRVVSVSASVGVVIRERDTDEAGELLRRADLAMYAAKAQGKSRYVSLSGQPDPARDWPAQLPRAFPA